MFTTTTTFHVSHAWLSGVVRGATPRGPTTQLKGYSLMVLPHRRRIQATTLTEPWCDSSVDTESVIMTPPILS
jgi:hypothetical protein